MSDDIRGDEIDQEFGEMHDVEIIDGDELNNADG